MIVSRYCKRLNFRGLKFSRIRPNLKILYYSRVLIFVNRRQFAKFAKNRSSRKFSRLQ
ncbi:MAG: hypothetical protein PV344_06150 [Anaplasma sp.]|nr:hypothetical protein [Anaplasma sp.]